MDDEGGDAPCWAERVCDRCGALVDAAGHLCPSVTRPVRRTIAGFHQDPAGDWVAELSCLHNQHVWHRPPFQVRPWVLVEDGRTAHLGTDIDCPLCARAELPEGLRVVRTAGPFDETTLPAALRGNHLVAEGTWARLQVTDGAVELFMQTEPPTAVRLRAGDRQPIPPGVAHALTLDGPVRLTIDFLVAG